MKGAGSPRPAADFRDQAIKDALDKTVRAYRPEKTRRKRLARIALVAALTVAAVAAFWIVLHFSTPKPAPKGAKGKPVAVELLPPR